MAESYPHMNVVDFIPHGNEMMECEISFKTDKNEAEVKKNVIEKREKEEQGRMTLKNQTEEYEEGIKEIDRLIEETGVEISSNNKEMMTMLRKFILLRKENISKRTELALIREEITSIKKELAAKDEKLISKDKELKEMREKMKKMEEQMKKIYTITRHGQSFGERMKTSENTSPKKLRKVE